MTPREKAFARIERGWHLKVLVRLYGGYDKIPADVWDWHDKVVAERRKTKREALLALKGRTR